MDYRKMFDSDYIKAWDLDGKDWTVTIKKVEAGSFSNGKGGNKKMPMLWFEEAAKAFGANKTNCGTIARLYGTDTAKWIGKKITMYPSVVEMTGQGQMDCIRIRPQVPAEKAVA